MAATWAYTYYHTHRHDDTATKVDHTQHTLTTTEAFTPWAAVNGDDPFRPLPANIPREKHRLSKKACTKPTHQNPFMNVLVGEFRPNPTRPPACTEREYRFVKRDIQTHFDDALTKDANDIYNTTQSQREFFTMPYTTIPNKQGGFAHWLYG
jgi:hypothetical protein